MSALLAGSTPKYAIRITDKNGLQLDPSDVAQVVEVRIWVYNSIDGTSIAKFYLNTPPSPIGDWRAAVVKTVAPGDKRVVFYLTSAETIAAQPNTNEIQIEITYPDADYVDGHKIENGVARFPAISPAKTD